MSMNISLVRPTTPSSSGRHVVSQGRNFLFFSQISTFIRRSLQHLPDKNSLSLHRRSVPKRDNAGDSSGEIERSYIRTPVLKVVIPSLVSIVPINHTKSSDRIFDGSMDEIVWIMDKSLISVNHSLTNSTLSSSMYPRGLSWRENDQRIVPMWMVSVIAETVTIFLNHLIMMIVISPVRCLDRRKVQTVSASMDVSIVSNSSIANSAIRADTVWTVVIVPTV